MWVGFKRNQYECPSTSERPSIKIKLGNCCSVDIYTRLNSLYFGESSNDHHHQPDQVLLFPLICQFDLPINDPISTSTRTSRFDRRSMSTDTVLSYYFGNTYPPYQPYNVQFKRNNIPTYIEIKVCDLFQRALVFNKWHLDWRENNPFAIAI